MNKRIKKVENILGIIFLISILVCSFGRIFFSGEYINYFFWLALGLYLGFHLCKYEINRIWKKEQEEQDKFKNN